jgi:hypothetical protein
MKMEILRVGSPVVETCSRVNLGVTFISLPLRNEYSLSVQ